MSRADVQRALALVYIFACFLQPLSATLIDQCSASSMSCTMGQGDMEALKEMEEAETLGMDVSLLQVPLTKQLEVDVDGHRSLGKAIISSFETKPIPNKFRAPFNCDAYPKMCEAPFECSKVANTSEFPLWITGQATKGLAANGPNFQSWCFIPQYQNYIHECLVKKDIAKAAVVQFQMTKAGTFGPNAYEMDGSYCFIEGHCSNNRVTHSTTLEEASQMCDERYGRSRWAKFGSTSSQDVLAKPPPKNASNGLDGQENTAPYLIAACAMGTYHCDVMYCKETHCKDEYLVKKFGHFLSDLGWTESKLSWMNPRQSLRGR